MNNRPNSELFLMFGVVLCCGWLLFVVYMTWQDLKSEQITLGFLAPPLLTGFAVAFGLTALIYGAVWAGQVLLNKYRAGEPGEAEILSPKQLAQRQRQFALEIRGVGLAVDHAHQSTLWRMIKDRNDNFRSVFPTMADEYPYSADSRREVAAINSEIAFAYPGWDAVVYWPLPTFALAPAKHSAHHGAADMINRGRNAAALGLTLFLDHHSENTTHAQSAIENLFRLFDEHSRVPQALLVSEDGDFTRSTYRVAGTPGLQDGHVVPKVYESMTGLLLARTDRVDRYLRPFPAQEPDGNRSENGDMGKLWAFYWRTARLARLQDESAQADISAAPQQPSTMSTVYWQEQLPKFWPSIRYKGPGRFESTTWLPVAWTADQIKGFDAAPMLGHLHRPIKVSMLDEHSKPLRQPLQAEVMRGAWLKALAALPEGAAPVRVFYDSRANADSEIALTNALRALNTDGNGLDPGNVEEGYDLGRRLGNTGVSSALVSINLATIASYIDGGTSAVVYSGSDGSVSVQMVRPPDVASKTRNAETRGADPFLADAAGVAST